MFAAESWGDIWWLWNWHWMLSCLWKKSPVCHLNFKCWGLGRFFSGVFWKADSWGFELCDCHSWVGKLLVLRLGTGVPTMVIPERPEKSWIFCFVVFLQIWTSPRFHDTVNTWNISYIFQYLREEGDHGWSTYPPNVSPLQKDKGWRKYGLFSGNFAGTPMGFHKPLIRPLAWRLCWSVGPMSWQQLDNWTQVPPLPSGRDLLPACDGFCADYSRVTRWK